MTKMLFDSDKFLIPSNSMELKFGLFNRFLFNDN